MKFRDHMREQLKDEEFASYWWEQDPTFKVGNLLIKLRMQHNLTQAQLAEKVGLKRPYISRLESGDANPTIKTLGRILGAFDMALVLDAAPREQGLFDEDDTGPAFAGCLFDYSLADVSDAQSWIHLLGVVTHHARSSLMHPDSLNVTGTSSAPDRYERWSTVST